MKWNYLHIPGCGKPAFVLTQLPQAGEVLRTRYVEHTNGTPVVGGERALCDTCGNPIGNFQITNVEAQ